MDIRHVLRPGSKGCKRQLRMGLGEVEQGISSGLSVVESMRRSGMTLSASSWSLLEVGEHTGKLGESMSKVGEVIRDGRNRRQEFIGQLWYPGFVFLTGIVVMVLILFWVVPRMRELGESMGLQGNLPWLTENIGALYGVLMITVLALSLGMVCLALLWRFLARQFDKPGQIREYLMKWIPVAGEIWRGKREADLQQQMANLLQGGITLPRTLDILAGLTRDRWEKNQLLGFRKRLLMGAGFEASMKRFTLFREENLPLLVAGQESGKLDEYLFRLSSQSEGQALWKLKQLVRLVEPLMLVFLAGAIGGLVLAYLLPMVRMFEQLSL